MKHFLKNYEVETTYEAATLALQEILKLAGFSDMGIGYEVLDQSDKNRYPWIRFEGDDTRFIGETDIENHVLACYKIGNVVTVSSYIYGCEGISVLVKKSAGDTGNNNAGCPFPIYTHIDGLGTYVGTSGNAYTRTDYVKMTDGTILPANYTPGPNQPASFSPLVRVASNDYTPKSINDRIIVPYIVGESDGGFSDYVYVSFGLPYAGSTANVDGKDMVVSYAFNSRVMIIDEIKDV